jgi:hypothetical protein
MKGSGADAGALRAGLWRSLGSASGIARRSAGARNRIPSIGPRKVESSIFDMNGRLRVNFAPRRACPPKEAVAPAGVAGLKASRLEPQMMSATDSRLADANKGGRQL